MSSIIPMVRKIAMGSLLPDSASSRGLSVPLRLIFLDWRMENIAVASVEENDGAEQQTFLQRKPHRILCKKPIATVVRMVPRVARLAACQRTGRIIGHLVSRPPAKRINTSEMIAIDRARE